jgi:hypothetical protein
VTTGALTTGAVIFASSNFGAVTQTGLSTHSAGDVVTALGTGATLTALATSTMLTTVAGYLDTEIADILTDTNELQTKLIPMLVVDGLVYQFTANALELGPGGGTGLTAQQTRDAMMLAPTAGAPAAGSIDDHLDDMPTDVWAAASRTLTQAAAQVASVLAGSDLTIQRGDTLTISLTGLGNISARTKLWFGLKSSASDTDAAAKVRIEETIGLEYINGASGTPANGSIVVTNATTGAATITLAAVESAKLSIATDWIYDVQMMTAAGVVTTLTSGWAEVVGDVVRTTS